MLSATLRWKGALPILQKTVSDTGVGPEPTYQGAVDPQWPSDIRSVQNSGFSGYLQTDDRVLGFLFTLPFVSKIFEQGHYLSWG